MKTSLSIACSLLKILVGGAICNIGHDSKLGQSFVFGEGQNAPTREKLNAEPPHRWVLPLSTVVSSCSEPVHLAIYECVELMKRGQVGVREVEVRESWRG